MLQKMLDNKAKRALKTTQRKILIDSIEVGIPSPQHILTWGERRLPNGERVGQIKNSKTVSYKRLTPLRDGLFCERIFGPVNSFVCSCGKTQPRADVTFCEKCQVEYTDQRTRRYRLGYISLLSPVAHIWYLKGRPSYLSLFLGQRKKKIVALAYCNAYLVEQGLSDKPYPNLSLAPAGVKSYNAEREAHGINRYTQNINSFTSSRQISNLADNSKSNVFGINNPASSSQLRHTNTSFQSMREKVISTENISLETQTENTNQISHNITKKRADTLTHHNLKKPSNRMSLMQNSSSKRRASVFHHFQEQINRAASPPRFANLLTEVLGHVEKNIVLIDSPKKDSENKSNPTSNNTGDLFSFRALWGYTCFEHNSQDCTNLRMLLNTARRYASVTRFQSRLKGESALVNGPEAGLFHNGHLDRSAFVLSQNESQKELFRQDTQKLIKTDIDSVSSISYYLQYAQECHKSSGKLSFQKASIDLTPRIHIFAASSLPLISRYNSLKGCPEYKALNTLTRSLLINPTQPWINCNSSAKLIRKDLILSAQKHIERIVEKRAPKESKNQRFITCYPTATLLPFQDQTAVISKTDRAVLKNQIEKIQNVGRKMKRHGNMPYMAETLCLAFKHARTVYAANRPAILYRSSIYTLMGAVNDDSKWIRRRNTHRSLSAPSISSQATTPSFFSVENPVGNSVSKLDKKIETDFDSNQSAKPSPHFSLTSPEPSLFDVAQTPQKGVRLYNRSHTFPFLPHLVCQYNLRDQLLNFLNSSPLTEDIPIPIYCKLPRRSPLRDVNQLMPEDTFSQVEARPLNHSNVSPKPSLAFSKQERSDFFKTSVNKNVRDIKVQRSGYSSQLEINAAARKSFLNVKAQGVGHNSSSVLFNNLNFDSKNKKSGVLSSNSKARIFHNAQTNSHQKDKADATISFNKIRTEKNQVYSILEQLVSLRNILYIALLQKSVVLSVNGLDARISKMSALLTSLSRENLIYNSIKRSVLKKPSFGLATLSNSVNRNESALRSQSLGAQSNRSAYFLTTNRGITDKKSLSLNGKEENSNLSELFLKQSYLNLDEKNLLRKIQHFDLPTQTNLKRLQDMPSLIRIINSLQLKSAEKSYRSLVLNKEWLGSSLLEKHLFDKENGALTHFNSNVPQNFMSSPKSTASPQGELAFDKQARLTPSIVHALRQHSSGKTKVNPYPFKTQKAWSSAVKRSLSKKQQLFEKRIQFLRHNLALRNTVAFNRRLKTNVLSHEKRLINRVYNLTFLLTHGEGSQMMPSACEPLSLFRYLERDGDFVREAVLFSCLPLGLKPKGLKDFLHTCSQAQSDSSLFERSLTPSLSWWVREISKNASLSGQELVTHLSGTIMQAEQVRFSSSLSFFLIAPKSKKEKQNALSFLPLEPRKQATLRKVSFRPNKIKNIEISEKQTSIQIQDVNGNSRVIESDNTLFDKIYHHINTSVSYQEAVQALPSKTKPSKRLFEAVEMPSAKAGLLEQSSIDSSEARTTLFQRDPRFSTSAGVFPPRQLLYPENRFNEPQKSIKASLQQDGQRSGLADSITFEEQTDQLSPFELLTIREILSYTGGGALHKLLQRFDTQLFSVLLFADVENARKIYKKRIANKLHLATRIEKRVLTRLRRRIYKNSRRLKIAQLLTRCKRRPEWMMISVLPVLPPDLRPILKMSEGAVVVSDLNNLYQRVVYRNNRFHRLAFIDFHFVTPIQRLVQDAVDRLLENGKGGSKPLSTPAGRPLKSLSDTLKGKKGRFRLNLLGKRVDFSGRSVIVVSPNLQIHECGIPRQIALELYNYFLIRLFVLKKQVSNVVMAKKLIKQKNSFVWDALRTLIYHHPVLLNRAPTLHRLGIQAFQPKLVQGNAICLNPLVCSGFNADFDGDQMGVHLPLSTQARAEAWDLLWSRNNLLSPATGQAVLVPSQDMVLGLYYMTQSFASRSVVSLKKQTRSEKEHIWDNNYQLDTELVQHIEKDEHLFVPVSRTLALANRVFFDTSQLLQAFQKKHILLHTPVWLHWKGKVENDEGFHAPIELRINSFASSTHIYSKYKRRKDENTSQSQLYIRTTAGIVLVNSIVFS